MIRVKNSLRLICVSVHPPPTLTPQPPHPRPYHLSSPITLPSLCFIHTGCLAIHHKCQAYFNLRIFALAVTSAWNSTLPTPPSPYLLVALLPSSLYSVVTYSVMRPFLDIQYKPVTLPSTSCPPYLLFTSLSTQHYLTYSIICLLYLMKARIFV